jgi:hypothetical protein
LLVQTFLNQDLFEFKKNVLIKQRFDRTTKNLSLAQKTLPFFREKLLKNQEKSQDFCNLFLIILDICFTNVHSRKFILDKNCFLYVIFRDIDRKSEELIVI